jgi:transposase InsO family protein
VARWTKRTELPVKRFLTWLELGVSKFYDWRERFGKVNEHNSQVPRDTWLEDWERQAIVAYHEQHPLEGYRRLAYMMLDADVVAVSASSVYRVLRAAGLLDRHNTKPSLKGTGFVQPLKAHQHWHVDIAFVNIANTFYFLCSILDGYSRAIVHWEIRPKMEEQDVEVIVQRAREKYPGVNPRIISDNGPQFIAKDFKQFIRLCGMTHVRTSPYYPQSNGKLERFHRTIKGDCLRPACPATLEEAQRHVTRYVAHYNTARLHSAIGYVTPEQKLAGMEQDIFDERDRKLAEARQRRAEKRREVAA